MSIFIKASRVAHLTDARYFAAWEVNFLGFNLEEGTEGYLDPMFMKAIREWVEGPKIVGEFSRSPIETVREAARFFALDAVQVSAKAHGEYLVSLSGLELILAVEMGETGLPFSLEKLSAMATQADYLLVHFPAGSAVVERLEWLRPIISLRPTLLEADIPAAEWPAILQDFGLAGISLSGSAEEQVGVKSFDEIALIFETLTGQ